MNAFSRFNSIFVMAAWEIVQELMIKTPLCTQPLIKIVLTIRQSPDMFVDYADIRKYMSGEKKFGSSQQAMAPHVLRDFVEATHIIHAVAHACLEFYVEKSMTVKPQRMNDSDLKDLTSRQNALFSELQTPGQPFQPKEFGPPSYFEEKIMTRVLWRLQIVLDLKVARRRGALAHWQEEDRDYVETKAISDQSRPGTTVQQNEQLLSVIDYVNEITGGQYGQPENALVRFMHQPPVAIYQRGYHLPCLPKPGPILRKLPFGLEILADSDTEIEHTPRGWVYYVIMSRNQKYSPVKHVSFEPYRKFGFAFWEADRMVELGFLGAKEYGYEIGGSPEIQFIWRSILTPEEDAERVSPARGRHLFWLDRQNKATHSS